MNKSSDLRVSLPHRGETNPKNHGVWKNDHILVCLEQTDTCNMTVWCIRSYYGFDEKLTLTL